MRLKILFYCDIRFTTYSPPARKQLFDGKEVSSILKFDSSNNDSADNESYLKNVGRISLSGVQPKASLVLDSEGHLVKPAEGEHGTSRLWVSQSDIS